MEHMCDALEIHARLEEDIFYPAIQARMLQDRHDLVEEALTEHKR
jgi:hypothetical protein